METGDKAEKKKSLKWFLFNRFLGMMLFIFVSEQLIGIFYNQIIIPGMSLMLQNLQISITASGKPILLLVQMLLYFLASFLPGGFDGYVQRSISAQMENSLRIAVDSPLFMGGWGIALRLLIIALFLVLILVSVMPYLTGAFYYCRIVTKKVNELVEEEKEQQQEYDRRRNLLLSDIAHDIKTPITTLCSYSKALSEDVVQGKKKQEYLEAIYQKSMRMNELITLLFEYVKMDSSGFKLHREDSDLAEILRESIAPLYSDFEEKKIELKVEIPEAQIPCCVDKIQMMRAVTNLLTNAVRYGKEGGKMLVQMDQYTITIADDGMEIDQEFAKHIFEPFSRADKARNTKGGSGLGLSIASKIIQMHGGKLELNREYGHGYTKAFRIMLREP